MSTPEVISENLESTAEQHSVWSMTTNVDRNDPTSACPRFRLILLRRVPGRANGLRSQLRPMKWHRFRRHRFGKNVLWLLEVSKPWKFSQATKAMRFLGHLQNSKVKSMNIASVEDSYAKMSTEFVRHER